MSKSTVIIKNNKLDIELKKISDNSDDESSISSSSNYDESDSDNENNNHDKKNDIIINKDKYKNISQNGLLNSLFERISNGLDDFNMLVMGEVSSGKTTLVNALLGDLYSETKMQRTTMGISLYSTYNITENDSQENIYNINKNINSNSDSGDMNFSHHKLNIPNIIPNYNGSRKINIIDIPGTNDPKINKNIFDIIENINSLVDVTLFVMDITQAFNTASNKNNTIKMIDKCKSHILFILNKYDEPNDDEINEMCNQSENAICEIMKKFYKNKKYNICRLSSRNEYINKMVINNNTDKLTPKEKNLLKATRISNFSSLYTNIIFLLNSDNIHLKNKIIKFQEIIDNDVKLQKFYNILNIYNITFTKEELNKLVNIICRIIDNMECQYHDFMINNKYIHEKYELTYLLRTQHATNELENIGNSYDKLYNFVNNNDTSSDDVNFILQLYFNNIIKIIKNDGSKFFKTNENHYNTLVNYGKLIKCEKNLICKEAILSYVNLITISNLLCVTTPLSLNNSSDYLNISTLKYKDKKDKIKYDKYLMKILTNLLLETSPDYTKIFNAYKNLNKLKYVCDENNNNISLKENFLVEIDFDNIHKYFEFLDIIEKYINT